MRATDRQLVQRTREGDREAFGALVDRYRDMVYGLGYHLTRDFEAARDLAQEAFVRAYLKLGQLREPDKFAGWLRRMVVNMHRNQSRRGTMPTAPLGEADRPARTQSQPSEIEVVVREALSKLREPERLALTLHYINGYSQAEIGSFLGVRPETVKTRLARARQHLRKEVMAMVEDTFESKKLPEEFTQAAVSAAIRHAEEHLRRGRVGAALQEYESVLRQNADYVPALLGMGMAQKMVGQEEEALRRFRRVVELGQADEEARGEMVHIVGGHHDRIEEAIALEEEMLRLHPEQAYLHIDLASNLVALQRYAEAEGHLGKALEVDPTDVRARIVQGSLLAFQGKYEEAAAVLEDAAPALAESEPYRIAYEWNRLELAKVRCAAGRYDEAIDTARNLLLLSEDSRVDRLVERCLQVAERCHHVTDRVDAFADFCRDTRELISHRGKTDRLSWYLALFLESRLRRNEASAEFGRLGAIPGRCWRAAVPFDNREGSGMATAYPPEQRVDLDDPDVGKDGRHLRWLRPVSDGLGFELNLMNQIQVNPFFFQWGLGYAVMRIISPTKREARLRFGAGGWTQVWLNGVSSFLARTCVGVPDSESVPLKLKRGENELLVKVGVHDASPSLRGEFYYWSLFSRITDAAGEPMRDLRFPLGE